MIVDAENTMATMKKVWDEIQSKCEQQRNQHLEKSANKKYCGS